MISESTLSLRTFTQVSHPVNKMKESYFSRKLTHSKAVAILRFESIESDVAINLA